MKISLICTVLNEKNTIKNFLNSILIQSKKPDELVVVDGSSQDGTVEEIRKFQNSNKKIKIKLIIKKGNRSIGRNTAIKNSTGDIILCSDAGCTLDKDWIKNMVDKFRDPRVDVVAGYYKGKTASVFQKCLVPYVLVMQDKIDPENFLPATRSMSFRKSIWKKVGGFDENLNNNEDYAFAKKLKKINANMVFAKKAIVYWKPRKNFYEAFVMFYSFALGDIEAGIVRSKVTLIFLRYIIGFVFLFLYLISGNQIVIFLIIFFLAFYVVWSIIKNYKYVRNIKAFVYLPTLQISSDIAVLTGTTVGFLKGFRIKK